MTLAELVADLESLAADYRRMEALVRADRLLELVIAKVEQVDLHGDSLDGPDMTTAQAADLLGLSTKTVERLCRDGQIRARRTSKQGRYRIGREALREYRGNRQRARKPNLKLWRA